ncbi:flagellar hook-associated protein FlgK [bacterium]|nr:flagellar hook-associated protein FlgK [bacterium]
MALNATLATASRALELFSTGVQVSANNIANANSPGYIREQLKIDPSHPFQRGSLIIGSGAQATSIKQVIDQYLEKRIQTAGSNASASQARQDIYAQLEAQLRELGDTDLSTQFSQFADAVNEVVNQPELGPLRSGVIEQGTLLASSITDLRSRVDDLRKSQTNQINDMVTEANGLIDQIQTLNQQISQQESNGLRSSDAGALRSNRYAALNRLSEIIPVRYEERDNGTIDLFSGSDYVILGSEKQHLETTVSTDRNVPVQAVRFDRTRTRVSQSGGELQGIIDGRDSILGGFVDQLDQLTAGVISAVNRIHSSGEGVAGYTSVTANNAVTDANKVLTDAGLAFSPENGSFTLKVQNLQSGITTSHEIRVDLDGLGGNDTTLDDLRSAIDAVDGVSASITTDGRLQLAADSNTELRFSNDSSGVLASLGINTFFTGSDSRNIGVNQVIAANRDLLATGQGGGPADNRNALQLASALDTAQDSLGGLSVNDFYNSVVSGVSQGSAAEQATAQGLQTYRDSLKAQREQYSGVSLDEEAVHMVEFQQAFAASARVIQTVDQLFQILVGL